MKKMEKVIHKLPESFIGKGEVKGFEFTKIPHSINNEFLLFKVKDNGTTWYEMFERKLHPVCLDFNKRIYAENEFKEAYPKSRSFGQTAWTFKTEEKAKQAIESHSQ